MFNKFKKNKSAIIRTLTEIIVMVISVSIIILLAENGVSFKHKNKYRVDEKELNIWYNDLKYETYFSKLSKEYEKDTGIKVNAAYMSDIDYLENINKANKKIDETLGEAPDIYLIDSEELEAAYRYGLAAENDNPIYNSDNYSETALNAITYKGKYVAYPLTFDTEFMIYNNEYFKSAPESFDSIVNYAKNFNSAENPDIKYIMYWNAEDIFHNYGFVGNYLNIGGVNGDDKSAVNINTDEVKKAFSYYTSLASVFRIGIDEDYSRIPESFINGEIVCSIVTMNEFNNIKNAENPKGISYSACVLPALNEELSSKSLSCTETLVVNYMSDKEKMAKAFAEYATYKRVDMIYDNTGLLSARHTNYMNEFYSIIQEQYDKSCSLPKLMMTSDYFMQTQSVLNKAWQGEDVSEYLDKMNDTYTTRLK